MDNIIPQTSSKYKELLEQASKLRFANPFTCSSGNRCGHDHENPRLDVSYPTSSDKRRPLILERIKEKIAELYKTPIQVLEFANDSKRSQRSERREACLSLLSAFVLFLDIATLKVVLPSGEGIPLYFFAYLAGLNLRRAQRACADLVSAALVTVQQVKNQIEDNMYRSSAAIRTINQEFFDVIGLGKWLKYERVRAVERREKKKKKQYLKDAELAAAHISLILKNENVKAQLDSKGEVTFTVEKKKVISRNQSIEKTKLRNERFAQLIKSGCSVAEATRKVNEEFPP